MKLAANSLVNPANRRLLRKLAGVGVATLVVMLAWWPANAWAADDVVESWQISYTVSEDGVLHVDETLAYVFGSTGRHGIDRTLTVREAWDDESDILWNVSNIKVSSPDAPDQFETSRIGGGRYQQIRIRIGDPDRTIWNKSATYRLTYDITGSIRSTTGAQVYDELYWDVLSDDTPLVNLVSLTVKVPGGVQEAVCFSGPVSSADACTSASISDGVATYTQVAKQPGETFTIAAKISPGLVSDNQPHLMPRADVANAAARNVGLATTGASAIATGAFVRFFGRRNKRDERFLGVAPGTIDEFGQGIGPDDNRIIPVSFSPPEIPVAAGGVIRTGAINVENTTATLISLAVRGAIQMREEAGPVDRKGKSTGRAVYARMVNPDVPMAVYEAALLQVLFAGLPLGQEVSLTGEAVKLHAAHGDLHESVVKELVNAGWYIRKPGGGQTQVAASSPTGMKPGSKRLITLGVVAALVVFAVLGVTMNTGASFMSRWLVLLGPLTVLGVGLVAYWVMLSGGQRSALGRAYADQVEGFREYIATAEADQLKFEEGQDVFSQYLPWATVFGLTDRWVKICARLVELGRLSSEPPTWYYGDPRGFNAYTFSDSIGNLSTMASSAAGEGSGFSSGSSGGGGGGGGVGSW